MVLRVPSGVISEYPCKQNCLQKLGVFENWRPGLYKLLSSALYNTEYPTPGSRLSTQGEARETRAGPRAIPTIAIGQLGQGDDDKLFGQAEGLEVVLQLIHDQAEVVSRQGHQCVTGHLCLQVAIYLKGRRKRCILLEGEPGCLFMPIPSLLGTIELDEAGS